MSRPLLPLNTDSPGTTGVNRIDHPLTTPEPEPLFGVDPLAPDRWMFEEAAAGICISGDSGSGKSVLMRHLIRRTAELGQSAIFLFDPHGDLAEDVLHDCVGLGPSVRRRVVRIAPGDTQFPIVPLNPLGIERSPGMSRYTYEARASFRARFAAHLMLATFGQDNFDGAPTLFRWTSTILRSLAVMGLSLADAIHFFDVGSDLHRKMTETVPDVLARMEFRRFMELPTAQQEEELASTRNRFVTLLSNPVLRAHLGVTGPAAADVRQLIRERAIVLVSLNSPEMALHEEDASLLANFWLSEVFNAVFSTPRDERIPCLACCDELPTFRVSAGLIARNLRMIRKFKLRFVGAFQGMHSFPKQKDDPLLRTMIQCGTRFYLRHEDPDDARFFADIIALPGLRSDVTKLEVWQPQQYQIDNKLVTLVDESFQQGFGETDTASQSTGVTANSGWSTATVNTHGHSDADQSTQAEGSVRNATDYARRSLSDNRSAGTIVTDTTTNAQQDGQSESTGRSQEKGSSQAVNKTQNQGLTHKQQLVPVLGWRQVLTQLELYTPEEIKEFTASKVAGLKKPQPGEPLRLEGFMSVAGQGARKVEFGLPDNPYETTPTFAEKKVAELMLEMRKRSLYHSGDEVESQRREFLQLVLKALENKPRIEGPAQSEPPNRDPPADSGIGI